MAKLDALPRPILKDLQKRAKKAEKHAVKYSTPYGIKTAEQIIKGETDIGST